MKEDKNNVLSDEEKKEYQKLKGLEKFGKLVGKELSEENKEKLENYRKRLGELMSDGEKDIEDEDKIPQELRQYRKAWEEKMEFIMDIDKQKIIQAAEKIPVKIENDSDGSRIITITLGKTIYEILDPKLENHIEDKNKIHVIEDSVIKIDGYYASGHGTTMLMNERDYWKDQKLKEYVKQKRKEGFHIPEQNEIGDLLGQLREKAELPWYESDKSVAMLMYLTGIAGRYHLEYGTLHCWPGNRCVTDIEITGDEYQDSANIFMMNSYNIEE